MRRTGNRRGVINGSMYHSDFSSSAAITECRMALPYELLIGLRYTRAKRRNHFISFISLISMLGIGLGRGRADRRAVGDERLSEGTAHAHSSASLRISRSPASMANCTTGRPSPSRR